MVVVPEIFLLRIVKVYSNILGECTASFFRMTECVSGGCWNNWGEGVWFT